KSEKLERQIEQLELRLEDLQQAKPAESAQALERLLPSAASPILINAPAKPARRPLPEHLPRTTQTHLPKQTACPDCGGELRKSRRRHLRDPGICTGSFPGDSPGAAQAELRAL